MNKAIILAGATLSAMAFTAGAHAQTIPGGTGLAVPTAGLTELYFSDNNFGGFNTPGHTTSNTLQGRNPSYIDSSGVGIGYDGTDPLSGEFPGAGTPGTAESFFQEFQLGSTGIAADSLQIGVHGVGVNPSAPVSVQVGIFDYSGNSAQPLGAAILTSAPILLDTVGASNLTDDFLDFSASGLSNAALDPNTTYVIGFASDISNYSLVDSASASRSGLSAAQLATASNSFTSVVNGGLSSAGINPVGSNPLAFRLYGNPFIPVVTAPAVPETGSLALLALGALPLGLLAARRRRAA